MDEVEECSNVGKDLKQTRQVNVWPQTREEMLIWRVCPTNTPRQEMLI